MMTALFVIAIIFLLMLAAASEGTRDINIPEIIIMMVIFFGYLALLSGIWPHHYRPDPDAIKVPCSSYRAMQVDPPPGCI